MPARYSRSLKVATLAAALLFFVPSPVAAAPADSGAGTVLATVSEWLLAQWTRSGWHHATNASQDAQPQLDPDGTDGTVPLALVPDANATQSASSDGEAAPQMDPNG